MDDKEIRVLILENLKLINDQNPRSYGNLYSLQNEETSEVEINKNVKYLDEKGLIDVQWYTDGEFDAKINSFGIDFLEQHYDLTVKESKEDIIPSIINETVDYVDNKLESLNPDILNKLNFIYLDLMDDTRDHPHNFARTAYTCREILMDFTDAIFNDEYLEENLKKPHRNHTKNKIRYTLKEISKSETVSNLISQRYDYIDNYFSAFSDFIQKNLHPDGFEATLEDAKSCLIYTYLFMRDILKLIDVYDFKIEDD